MRAQGERRSPAGAELAAGCEVLAQVAPGIRRLGIQLALFKHVDVWIERWLVDSRSQGRAYVVARSAIGRWGCSCPRWIYHRENCFHIRRVQATHG